MDSDGRCISYLEPQNIRSFSKKNNPSRGGNCFFGWPSEACWQVDWSTSLIRLDLPPPQTQDAIGSWHSYWRFVNRNSWNENCHVSSWWVFRNFVASFNDFAHIPWKKIPQTSPNPQQRKKFLDKLLVKRPGAHLPGGPVGEILESWFFTKIWLLDFWEPKTWEKFVHIFLKVG